MDKRQTVSDALERDSLDESKPAHERERAARNLAILGAPDIPAWLGLASVVALVWLLWP